jgi:hypothetical protein
MVEIFAYVPNLTPEDIFKQIPILIPWRFTRYENCLRVASHASSSSDSG